MSNMAHELPGVALVSGGIEVYLCLAEVVGDTVPSEQYGPSSEVANGLW